MAPGAHADEMCDQMAKTSRPTITFGIEHGSDVAATEIDTRILFAEVSAKDAAG